MKNAKANTSYDAIIMGSGSNCLSAAINYKSDSSVFNTHAKDSINGGLQGIWRHYDA